MDVIQERLEREFNIDLIMTAPSVIYKVNLTDGEALDVSNPSEFPDPTKIASIEEPYVKAQIMVPQEFVGAVMELAQRKRGHKIVARTDIKALRKNVLAKCYGGDVSRKRKLLEKQKAGKKRMKAIGSVEVPQEAFLSVLSMDEE